MTDSTARRTIDTIWRMESSKIIAGLTRMVRDLDLAEDLAQDALVIALRKWPETGIPDNPGAWLMVTAKRRAIDMIRRNKIRDKKVEELGRGSDLFVEDESSDEENGEIGDDLLRLIFMTCHPILSREARIALTLRLLGGLSTDEIAHAFFVSEPTIAQRIVRAKRTLREARADFEVPTGSELKKRLETVLEVIYLLFNEGYAATSGSNWLRPLLCQEALRLGRILAEVAPAEPEVHGLVALMELQSSRFKTRVTASGEPILLKDQNRAQWDHLLIRRGLAALERAQSLGRPLGPYALQASISACHSVARSAEETDWVKIAALYEALSRVMPSSVVELNRAVAIAMAFGPEFGLQLVELLEEEAALKNYHLLPSVKGDLLEKLGRNEEARDAFRFAASLTKNEQEQQLLLRRAAECESTRKGGRA
ncbi:RNA polymerase sigma factor [Brevibacillus ruminantium]|uniref:RNA polymerase sigma factor n=1 Tax=Brevibacillus ruminantium TaxID=2950604 RepID=A0ABY4WGY5_9BACL|nr:RNA polymerase sigma factor [Brevibacillus ruminantium]USG66129.1 RNA polymerase sigma factor [Brevibacillus ruminantium]